MCAIGQKSRVMSPKQPALAFFATLLAQMESCHTFPPAGPRTLINSLGPEKASRRSSVDKPWVPHDHLRNVSGTLLALKVIFPTLVGPLRANVQAIDQRSRKRPSPTQERR